MKRIVLFLVTNLAVMLVLGLVVNILGLNQFLSANGLSLGGLLAFAAVMGFGGAQVINDSPDATHQWIVTTVKRFADKAGIQMPEVAIYEGDANAFATGAFKNSALVAVSTGLLRSMNRDEVEAVIGHEVAHVANGDMVTMTLIQGVMNTFVVFASRVIGSLVDGFLRRGSDSSGPGIGYYATTIVLDILFGFLAGIVVAWFSRQREFRADRGAAQFMGQPRSMINALARLGNLHAEGAEMPKNLAAMGIAGSIGKLFATHPPMEERIAALKAYQG